MIAIYKLVNRKMVSSGSENVSKACDMAIKEFKKITVRASTENGSRIMEHLISAEQLRKRFYYAKKCSEDAVNFPDLHKRVIQMQATIDEDMAFYRSSKIDIEKHENLE